MTLAFRCIGDLSPRLSYAGGVFNGVPDGTSSTSDVDANNGKDVAGRVVWQPFRSSGTPARALNSLGFQIGGSIGSQTGTLPSFRTSVGQTYFAYAIGAAAAGDRARVTPAVFYYYKSFGGFAEYVRSVQEISRAGSSHDVTNQGWGLTGVCTCSLAKRPPIGASARAIHSTRPPVSGARSRLRRDIRSSRSIRWHSAAGWPPRRQVAVRAPGPSPRTGIQPHSSNTTQPSSKPVSTTVRCVPPKILFSFAPRWRSRWRV